MKYAPLTDQPYMEYCTVYFSSATELFAEEELSNILRESRQNNTEAGITGVLLYVRGSIMQVLEGEKDQLDALYQRIEQDPRHKDITRVLNRPITHRLFPAWSMGYETLTSSQLAEISTLVNLDNHGWLATQNDVHPLLRTIKSFYESNQYN